MGFQYKVVPFIGHTKGSLSAIEVARQLETVIRQHAALGWEFHQLSDVNIEVRPGCISGLFGAKVEYARFDQLIFRADEGATLTSTAEPSAEESDQVSELASGSPRERTDGWSCSCGQVNPLTMARCSGCRKWRLFREP
jgi:hypothetical protein